jgi:HTH-type transcriptional regulator/antitoxin HigA
MKITSFADYLVDYLEINNITNKDFANRINITPKHLIDILSGKAELSSKIIDRISLVTGISADYIYRIELNKNFEKEIYAYLQKNNYDISEYVNKFCYKYLIQDNWIKFTDKRDKFEILKDILKFLRVPNPNKVYEIDSDILYKSKNDKTELLLLWLEKCYRITLTQQVEEYKKENIDDLVDYIRDCAQKDEFDEINMISKFNEKGICLVIQNDIPGSKIRGAFKVHRDKPAIYITYKHKRPADIYFALLHELAHCKSDYNMAKSKSMISYDNESDEIENKADTQAYDWMVPNQYYNDVCKVHGYDVSNEMVYPKSFVVYRLAKDGVINYCDKVYQKYNKLMEK